MAWPAAPGGRSPRCVACGVGAPWGGGGGVWGWRPRYSPAQRLRLAERRRCVGVSSNDNDTGSGAADARHGPGADGVAGEVEAPETGGFK